MQSRKTPYGWMALGGMLCLLGLGLACKMRESNQAQAQAEPVPAVPSALPPLLPGDDDKVLPVPTPPVLTTPSAGTKPLVTDPLPEVPQLPVASVPTLPIAPLNVPLPPGSVPPSRIMKLTFQEPSPEPIQPPTANPQPPVSTPTPPQSTVMPPDFRADTLPPPVHHPEKATAPPSDSLLSPPLLSPPPTAPTVRPDLGGIVTPTFHSETDKKVTSPMTTEPPSVTPVHAEAKPSEPGEPPLAPAPGPVQMYQVLGAAETMRDLARRTLGDTDRWVEIHKLNPALKPDVALPNGAVVRLPADACLRPEEVGDVKPLPLLRPDAGPAKPKVLQPLTGTYPCNLDEKHVIALPRAMRDQLGEGEMVMVSPGPDHCLWVTTQDHLERLAKRLEASSAREHEVRSFRRLYFAQTEKLTLTTEGRIQIPDRLTAFAGLHQEVVLIGIDDHFELWDVARWRQYTQAKSAAARSAMTDD